MKQHTNIQLSITILFNSFATSSSFMGLEAIEIGEYRQGLGKGSQTSVRRHVNACLLTCILPRFALKVALRKIELCREDQSEETAHLLQALVKTVTTIHSEL